MEGRCQSLASGKGRVFHHVGWGVRPVRAASAEDVLQVQGQAEEVVNPARWMRYQAVQVQPDQEWAARNFSDLPPARHRDLILHDLILGGLIPARLPQS